MVVERYVLVQVDKGTTALGFRRLPDTTRSAMDQRRVVPRGSTGLAPLRGARKAMS